MRTGGFVDRASITLCAPRSKWLERQATDGDATGRSASRVGFVAYAAVGFNADCVQCGPRQRTGTTVYTVEDLLERIVRLLASAVCRAFAPAVIDSHVLIYDEDGSGAGSFVCMFLSDREQSGESE